MAFAFHPRSKFLRTALRVLLPTVLALALLAGAAAWLFTQPQGARVAARAIAALSGGRIALEGVQGRLAGPLTIGRLTLQTADTTVKARTVHLDWQASALWRGQLHIRSLDIARLSVHSRQPRAAARVPASLRPPLSIELDRLTVGEIVYGTRPTVLRDLVASWASHSGRYRLRVQHLATPWASLRGDASLGESPPFPLAARMILQRAKPQRLEMDAALAGSLLEPRLQAQATGDGLSLELSGTFRPFAALPIVFLDLQSRAMDLRALAAQAPTTRLDVTAHLGSSGPQTLAGNISLRNAIPGPLNRGRLPLLSARAELSIQPALAEIAALHADLGAAGQAAGAGRWQNGRYSLHLNAPALNLAGLDSRFFPTRYAVGLALDGDTRQQTLLLSARQGKDHLDTRLVRRAGRIDLTQLSARLRGARLDATGELTPATSRSFALNARLADFNPAAFGRFPRGRLNARLAASGSLAPRLIMAATLSLPAGQLGNSPVKGQAQLNIDWPRMRKVHADLDLAGNRLALAGAWGGPHDRLRWNVDAPRLDRLGFGLAGRLRSSGQLAGVWPHPEAIFNAEGHGLNLPDRLHAAALHIDARLARGLGGPLQVETQGQGIHYGRIVVERLRLTLAGTLARHRLSAQAQLPQAKLSLTAAGGWAKNVWAGEITAFEAQGKPSFSARLLAPAKLLLSAREQRLQNVRLDLAGGEADITLLQHGPAGLVSRGRLLHLPVAPLLALAPRPLPFTSDLVLEGSWNLSHAGVWRGELHVARSRGDIVWHKPRLAVGLSNLDLKLAGTSKRLQGTLAVDSQNYGRLDVDGWISQTRGPLWPLPPSTLLNIHARGQLPTLAALRSALPVGAQLNAQAGFDLRADGSLAAPELSGHLDVRNITASFPDLGLRVKDGVLDLALARNRIQVSQGWLAGEQGRVLVSGGGDWQAGGALLNLDFADFALLTRPDVQARVSGATRLELHEGKLTVAGRLKVVRARVATIAASRPHLSKDVVVLGRPHRPRPGPSVPVNLDLALDLGDDFLVQAYGLDAQLQGQLELKGSGQPAASGNIRVSHGTYTAYGQRLSITRGQVSFFGPLDDPGLNILAVRQTDSITAGVALTGTAQRPRVSLYSNPTMPDSETLSWLLFGHGLSSVSGDQFSLLQTAAAALLSKGGGAGPQATLAEKLGLSSVDIRSGSGSTLAGTVVSLGKQFSRSFRVRYERSLDGLTQIVRAYYTLSPTLSLQAQTGNQSGLDVLYSREFE